MHVTRSSHRKERLVWNLSHGKGNAFRVHKKNRQTVATGWLQLITTTHSQNGQIIIYLAFLGIIDHTSYTGQNYRTNTIIIVNLATLILFPVPLNELMQLPPAMWQGRVLHENERIKSVSCPADWAYAAAACHVAREGTAWKWTNHFCFLSCWLSLCSCRLPCGEGGYWMKMN